MASRISSLVGWILVTAGIVFSVWLDPWSYSAEGLVSPDPELQKLMRYGHVAVMRMAFLQLALSRVFAREWFEPRTRIVAAWLTCGGVMSYAVGHVFLVSGSPLASLIPFGSSLTLTGLLVLVIAALRLHADPRLTGILLVVCAGMLLDITMGLLLVDPSSFRPAALGADDELPMRMLRLGQVATIALAALAILYYDTSPKPQPRRVNLGQWAMTFGAFVMPILLAAAAVTTPLLKHLMGLPAWAVIFGTAIGIMMCAQRSRYLEAWGWCLITLSLLIGLSMGMYAFDGPLPAPEFIGEYNDPSRRLLRLAHAYAIVLGMLTIFTAELSRRHPGRAWPVRLSSALLIIGSVSLLAVMMFVALEIAPAAALAVGPALVAFAVLLSLGSQTVAVIWKSD